MLWFFRVDKYTENPRSQGESGDNLCIFAENIADWVMKSDVSWSVRLRHWVTSGYHRGRRVHSPYVYRLMTEVLTVTYPYYCFEEIEEVRGQLPPEIRHSCLSRRNAQMLFRLVLSCRPVSFLEFGSPDPLVSDYLEVSLSHSCGRRFRWRPKSPESTMSREQAEELLTGRELDMAVVYPDVPTQVLETLLDACVAKASERSVVVTFGLDRSSKRHRIWETRMDNPKVSSCIDMGGVGIFLFRPELEKRCYRFRR